jgi:hypothetical protein
MVMTTEITAAKIGRSMKKCEMRIYGLPDPSDATLVRSFPQRRVSSNWVAACAGTSR